MSDFPSNILALFWIVGCALGLDDLALDVHHVVNHADSATLPLSAPDNAVT
ncbi:hypothetical protein [Streptomyces sp. H39-S7]|uniref:hypothetical protein n=1 Tax=Streptomyces sp. H39-S7 TaxID=3004357 RepID=UPI0022AE541E|nr:hypothetical protein [Streptomyces sp. H39-S7]MCZ4123918.1 hypothetical protein [Streptomyces sp. H39-S7]